MQLCTRPLSSHNLRLQTENKWPANNTAYAATNAQVYAEIQMQEVVSAVPASFIANILKIKRGGRLLLTERCSKC